MTCTSRMVVNVTTFFTLMSMFIFNVCLSDRIGKFRICKNQRLPGNEILLEGQVSNQLECARLCWDSEKCRSANFIRNDHVYSCQLLPETSTCNDSLVDQDSDFLTFTPPRCVHGGSWNESVYRCVDCDHGFTGVYCERHIFDCVEGKQLGYAKKQKILIQPRGAEKPMLVSCGFGAGEVEIERRGRRTNCASYENFNRTWEEYKNGFGDIDCDYFIGLEYLHKLTSQRDVYLHVVLQGNVSLHGKYLDFSVDSEANNYTMHYSMFSQHRTNPGGDGFGSMNNTPFCTPDHDCGTCARDSHSGWWFNAGCATVNLNIPLDGATYFQWPKNDDTTFEVREEFFLKLVEG